VYRVGGAQAIGALASGTKTIPAVDVIVGPGNIFVATAKRLVYGKVGIDSFAGPSEVVILADGSADPRFIASDMLAQAEHDERASSILVTTDETLAIDVLEKIVSVVPLCPRAEIIERSLMRASAIYLVKNIAQGIDVVNQLAPEHLEVVVKNPEAALKKIRHAGSIFVGNFSPVALGDYWAGPNHVLPTGGTARFSSPLSVDDFMKKSSVILYSQSAMQKSAADIAVFAEHEGLTVHALSLLLRGKGVLSFH
jgi:histidinol dehydrogenase